jgi:hypothetical protein
MIHVRLMGGMGNQMFQYALARSLAIKHRTEARVDLSFLLDRSVKRNFVFRDYDLGIFDVEIKPSFSPLALKLIGQTKNRELNERMQRLVARGKNVVSERSFAFDPDVLESPDNSLLIGYWQSERYFIDRAEEIRKCFALEPRLNRKQKEMNNRIAAANSVCLNVRRGDFVGNTYHGTMGVDYFERAANAIAERSPAPVFFVFSDDVAWCQEQIELRFETHYVDHAYAGPRFGVYLKLMTGCNHFIIPNSSFGWWAAWLGNREGKIAIAPEKWFEEETIDTSDLIPAGWLRL